MALSGDNEYYRGLQKASEAEKQEIQDIENMESTIEEYVTGTKVEQVTDVKLGKLEVDGSTKDENNVQIGLFVINYINKREGRDVLKIPLKRDFKNVPTFPFYKLTILCKQYII